MERAGRASSRSVPARRWRSEGDRKVGGGRVARPEEAPGVNCWAEVVGQPDGHHVHRGNISGSGTVAEASEYCGRRNHIDVYPTPSEFVEAFPSMNRYPIKAPAYPKGLVQPLSYARNRNSTARWHP